MMMRPRTRLGLLAACAACGGAPTPASVPAPPAAPERAPHWELPAGWREEVLPFPLDFAPAVGRRGVEVLRFPPGFLDAQSPRFWSYAFVWWPGTDERHFDDATIGPALATYFDGLIASVNGSTHKIAGAPPATRVELTRDPAGLLHGAVAIVDPFATGAPVALAAHVRFVDCGPRRAVIFAMSPAPASAPPHQEVLTLAAAFACPR